jgi:hypothetical protein
MPTKFNKKGRQEFSYRPFLDHGDNHSGDMSFRANASREREIHPDLRLQALIIGDFSAFGLEMTWLKSSSQKSQSMALRLLVI